MRVLLDLFCTFFKIGLFTFGGGYAMISPIEQCCVEEKHWITHEDMMNVTVIAESTPGPIAVNCATFVGCKAAGFVGALVATFGVVLPSFLVIFLIAEVLGELMAVKAVASAFKGLRIGVGILILDAAVNMLRKMQAKPLTRGIMLCAFALMLAIDLLSLHLSSIVLMLFAGLVSLSVFCMQGAAKGGENA